MKKQTILIVSIIVALAIVFGVAIICNNDKDTNNTTTPTESITDITENTNGETNSTENSDQNNQNITNSIPEGVKDGDELEGGSFYFDDVTINSYDGAVAFLKKYNLHKEGESYFINYETPKYYGLIIYVFEEDHFTIIKNGENFYQEYTYSRDGVVDSNCWETDNKTDESKEPIVLEHGVKIDDTTVYIDTDIVDIEVEQNVTEFIDLVTKYFGDYNDDTWYHFVTDDTKYTVGIDLYNRYVVQDGPCVDTPDYIINRYNYNQNKVLVEKEILVIADGERVRTYSEKDGNTYEQKVDNNGDVVHTNVVNGITTMTKYRQYGEHIYPYYHFVSGTKEFFLTYDADGKNLIAYKALDLKNNEVYDWVLDGVGLGPDHYVSVVITKNGSSKTYVGQNEIPWGAAIYYPPKWLGLCE